MKTVDQALQSYQQGKYSAFWALFEAQSDEIYSFFSTKTSGNTRLSEYLTGKTFERFIALSNSEKKELTEESFKELLFSLAEEEFSAYQGLSEFSSEKRNFKKELKSGLSQTLEEKKAQNPRYFRFYVEHFRFYFAGFSIAVGIGLAAFLLGFLTFNKTPKIFSNPKLFISTGDDAFGVLNVDLAQNKIKNQIGSGFSEFSFSTGADGSLQIRSQAQYQVSEKQLPKLPSSTLVGKAAQNNQPELATWLKWLHLPALNLSSLKSAVTEEMRFSSGDQVFTLNLAQGKLAMESSFEKGKTRAGAISDSAIINQIQSQLLKLGLKLDQYGDARIQTRGTHEVLVFMPQVFNRLPIMDERGLWEGIFIRYALTEQRIISFENFSFQSYFTSKYPVKINAEHIFSQLAAQGIQKTDGNQNSALSLGNGVLAYQKKDGFLIPVLAFSKDNGQLVAISIL